MMDDHGCAIIAFALASATRHLVAFGSWVWRLWWLRDGWDVSSAGTADLTRNAL